MVKIQDDISSYINYKLLIAKDVDITQLLEVIPKTLQHPNIISPVNVVREKGNFWFLYKVYANGMTLRNWIHSINNPTQPKNSIRTTLRKTLFQHRRKINHLDIILKLIDACEFMLANNMSFGQSNINPDLIWIEYDSSNNLQVRLLNTFESMGKDIYGCVFCDNHYWSPELISKYNHIKYYDSEPDPMYIIDTIHADFIEQHKPLKRYNTRPSTLSSVYSLGLILYFITNNEDPFIGTRVHPYDRPYESTSNDKHPNISTLIRNVTNPDIKERPTMQEWKVQIINNYTKPNMNTNCNIM